MPLLHKSIVLIPLSSFPSFSHSLAPSPPPALSVCVYVWMWVHVCVFVCLLQQSKFSFVLVGQCVTVPWPWCLHVLTVERKNVILLPPKARHMQLIQLWNMDMVTVCLLSLTPHRGVKTRNKRACMCLGCLFKSLLHNNRGRIHVCEIMHGYEWAPCTPFHHIRFS